MFKATRGFFTTILTEHSYSHEAMKLCVGRKVYIRGADHHNKVSVQMNADGVWEETGIDWNEPTIYIPSTNAAKSLMFALASALGYSVVNGNE